MKKKLSVMPYAQAHVYIDSFGDIHLISYTTIVAKLTHNGLLIVYGLYSATTRRHIGAFMREYLNSSYQTAKALFESGMAMDTRTGELIDRALIE